MKRVLAILLLSTLSACAIPDIAMRDQYGVLLPPARFIHDPAVPVIYSYLPKEELVEVCKLQVDGLIGCAFREPTYCVVKIARGLPPLELADIREHELAHCNEWEHAGE